MCLFVLCASAAAWVARSVLVSCRPRVAVLVFWYPTMADMDVSAEDFDKEKKRVTEKIVTALRGLMQESEQHTGTFTRDMYDALGSIYPDPEHKQRFATNIDQLRVKLVADFGLSAPPDVLEVPVCKRPRPSVHRHTDTQTHRHTADTQTHRHTADTQKHRLKDTTKNTTTQV